MFVLAPKLAGLMLLGIPLVLGADRRSSGARVRAISTRSQDRIADVGTVTSEVLGAMKIVQAFNQQKRESDALRRRSRARLRDRQAAHRCSARS